MVTFFVKGSRLKPFFTRRGGRLLAGVMLAAFSLPLLAAAGDDGLVAHFSFDEGPGPLARDASGRGNDGRIHGARFVKRGRGFSLQFDGVDDFVDCGAAPSLDLRGAASLEAWVYPERHVQEEVGILGKHFDSFLLSYYTDGQCWWYISSGGNNAKSLLTPGSWHHLAGTFDGAKLKLFIDGQLAGRQESRFSSIQPGKRLFLGCVLRDAAAEDPSQTRGGYFPGELDEVRFYSRALSEAEIAARFNAMKDQLDLLAGFQPVAPAASLEGDGLTAAAGKSGQLELKTGKGVYSLESFLAYPGESIGWNALSEGEGGGEPLWAPQATLAASKAIEIRAQGNHYALKRCLRIERGTVAIEDEVTQRGAEPAGIVLRHLLTSPAAFREAFTASGAENPAVFLAGERESLGILPEDDVSRLRLEAGLGLPRNQARLRIGDVALEPGKSRVFRFRFYFLEAGADRFAFFNRVRRDWKSNFTILGPFSFFDVGSPLLDDPGRLRAYLQRRRLRIAALSPWLDYDPGSFDRVWPREEYKRRMQQAARALKAVDPEVRCLGCIETDWVAIDPAKISGGEKLPQAAPGGPSGNYWLSDAETRILDAAELPWKDSVKRSREGQLKLELYSRGGRPQTSLSVYPRPGNFQHGFLLEQVRFLLDEVGLDGFYIDEFSQSWTGSGIRSYEGEDGLSAEVDPGTGCLGRRFVDCGLAGIETRVELCKYALERGKLVVANTYASSMAEQALAMQRFAETQGMFDPMAVADGEKPPLNPLLLRGALASPIGLGIVGASGKRDAARRLMKAVVFYLRHGLLYYHYALEDLPESGEGSGEYGPVNRMFPLTPVALHEGWIEGEERIITAVSGDFRLAVKEKPAVHLYDLSGREKPPRFALEADERGWKVAVRLRDWAEIAVIERLER